MKEEIQLHIEINRLGDSWVAECIEFDLCGHGPTRDAALLTLFEAIMIQTKASIDYANPANLWANMENES